MNNPPLLHSVDEACHLLGGISRSTLYGLISEGKVSTLKVGARTLIPHATLADYVTDLSRLPNRTAGDE
jgi:excisionase family DNA binding protein